MKYLIIFILLLSSCSQQAPTLEVLDGCEYIIIKNELGNIIEIEHRGNCENSIHLYQDTMDMSEPHTPSKIYVRQVN